MPKNKFNRSKAHKLLVNSEGEPTNTGTAGHARAKHSAPTLAEGPSVDAYLRRRCTEEHVAVGGRRTAFLNDRDQDRAVAFALSDRNGTVTDNAHVRNRKTIIVDVNSGTLDLNVRVATVGNNNNVEYSTSKLRQITVVYEVDSKGKYKVVTAFPSLTNP